MIKPIPTYYKNQRYRSRLEAKWAVFFSEIGLTFEYEPEGVVLSTGEPYLPDFYFPNFENAKGCFAEVKHLGGDFTKAITLGFDTKIPIMLLEGNPTLAPLMCICDYTKHIYDSNDRWTFEEADITLKELLDGYNYYRSFKYISLQHARECFYKDEYNFICDGYPLTEKVDVGFGGRKDEYRIFVNPGYHVENNNCKHFDLYIAAVETALKEQFGVKK